jgi:hypothetical protein
VCPNCIEDECVEENNRAEAQTQDTQYKQTNAKETTLKILQLNIDSILSKTKELRDFIKKNDIDIFLIQQTKLIKSTKDPQIYDRKKRQSAAEGKRER